MPSTFLEEFLQALDKLWGPSDPRVRLPIFGSVALLVQSTYKRATKDGDVLETLQHTPEVKTRLIDLAGRGTKLHQQHGLYLEFVASGIPFLPHTPRWHRLPISLGAFDVDLLDVVDVVVSKLARFSPQDHADIEAMVERELVSHADLVERFRLAVDVRSYEASGDQLPLYIERLHELERDTFGVEETMIDLPSWL